MLLVCEPLRELGPSGTAAKNSSSVTAGLTPRPAPTKPGLHLLTPNQVAGLRVEPVRVGRDVTGYQRELRPHHARTIARRLAEGEPMPPILYAVDDPRENGEIVDGQHRAAASIIARQPIWAVCFEATPDERRRLFANQAKAATVNRNTLILSGDKPWHDYLKRAATHDAHPWVGIVTTAGKSTGALTVAQAFSLITRFVAKRNDYGSISDDILAERWDEDRADLLAELLRAFGTKRSNPHAWSAIGLRSIVAVANLAIPDGQELDQVERWCNRMPSFDFAAYRYLGSSDQLTDRLLEHWNRGLRQQSRIERRAA